MRGGEGQRGERKSQHEKEEKEEIYPSYVKETEGDATEMRNMEVRFTERIIRSESER